MANDFFLGHKPSSIVLTYPAMGGHQSSSSPRVPTFPIVLSQMAWAVDIGLSSGFISTTTLTISHQTASTCPPALAARWRCVLCSRNKGFGTSSSKQRRAAGDGSTTTSSRELVPGSACWPCPCGWPSFRLRFGLCCLPVPMCRKKRLQMETLPRPTVPSTDILPKPQEHRHFSSSNQSVPSIHRSFPF